MLEYACVELTVWEGALAVWARMLRGRKQWHNASGVLGPVERLRAYLVTAG